MATTAIRRVTTAAGDPAWLVSEHKDIKALMSDPRLSRSHPEPERAPRASQSVIMGGPSTQPLWGAAGHARFRRLIVPVFSARRMASVAPRITDIVADLLDAMAHRTPPVDLHEVLSTPLPTLTICELLGVPYPDREDFRRWSIDAGNRIDAARSQAGLTHLCEYMRALVDRKQAEPDDGLISALVATVATDPELTTDDIVSLGALLLFAGQGSTAGAIDRGTVLLLAHPEQADEIRHDPALIVTAVEEMLRGPYERSADVDENQHPPAVYRYANSDVTLDDVTIRTGELVVFGFRAANHDERLFPEPYRFDVHRTPNPHLTFGHGLHFCVGAHLARMQLKIVFPALLSRFPALHLAVPAESLRRRDEQIDGGLVELPVTW